MIYWRCHYLIVYRQEFAKWEIFCNFLTVPPVASKKRIHFDLQKIGKQIAVWILCVIIAAYSIAISIVLNYSSGSISVWIKSGALRFGGSIPKWKNIYQILAMAMKRSLIVTNASLHIASLINASCANDTARWHYRLVLATMLVLRHRKYKDTYTIRWVWFSVHL